MAAGCAQWGWARGSACCLRAYLCPSCTPVLACGAGTVWQPAAHLPHCAGPPGQLLSRLPINRPYLPPCPPPTPKSCRYGDGREALYRIPGGNVKGTCIFIHGCKHDPYSWFYRSKSCKKCTGEPPLPPPQKKTKSLFRSPVLRALPATTSGPPPHRHPTLHSHPTNTPSAAHPLWHCLPLPPHFPHATLPPRRPPPRPSPCRPARGGGPHQAVPGRWLRRAGPHVARPRVPLPLLLILWKPRPQ